MSKLKLLDTKPFIAATRLNNELLNNILDDNYPVLLEGLHLGAYINIESKLRNDEILFGECSSVIILSLEEKYPLNFFGERLEESLYELSYKTNKYEYY